MDWGSSNFVKRFRAEVTAHISSSVRAYALPPSPKGKVIACGRDERKEERINNKL
jgi:hypothetical protein